MFLVTPLGPVPTSAPPVCRGGPVLSAPSLLTLHLSPTQEDPGVLEHPQSDVPLAGSTPLPAAFHNLLQTISDLMPLLPAGSSLQLMAVRWERTVHGAAG